MHYIWVLLHHVSLCSGLAMRIFRVAVCKSLPVEGIRFILGSNIVGGKVLPDEKQRNLFIALKRW